MIRQASILDSNDIYFLSFLFGQFLTYKIGLLFVYHYLRPSLFSFLFHFFSLLASHFVPASSAGGHEMRGLQNTPGNRDHI